MTPKQTSFRNILIANRGEIACRVIRTAKALGLQTIAVYSEADGNSPHVKMADEAYLLGPAPVGESYLDMDRIMTAIRETGAEAVHPGYGFLSENAAFAKACEEAGIVFIGPNIEAIDIMGDKAKSKRRMIEAEVPCVPGYQGEDQSDATLIAQSGNIGFPMMVKAAAGGGGRGMRLVHSATDLPDALKMARSEAENAFGSGDLILERAILQPRHVEIQIFADKHGNVIHLGERDCSVQRRHQKVLEEAPCPVMTPELRDRMGAAAVKAAQDIKYIGAGTVEFLLDSKGAFYFLEMNTRLQVEHPVTEMVTGLDLVALQIRVAKGEALGLTQNDICLTGHAIEARLYAEDPSQDFLPATGPIDLWYPAEGNGIRIDAGIMTGGEISPFYDPMIAKVISYGASREEARSKLIHALKQTALFGVVTNNSFLIDALEKPDFTSGAATTAFIAENFPEDSLKAQPLTKTDAATAAVLLFVSARQKALAAALNVPTSLLNWSSATQLATPYQFSSDTDVLDVNVTPMRPSVYHVEINNEVLKVEILTVKENTAVLTINDSRISLIYNYPQHDTSGQTVQLSVNGRDLNITNLNGIVTSAQDTTGAGSIIAPMHGLLLEVFVKPGDSVKTGDRLAILEAMKMQHELNAEIDGTVTDVNFGPGAQVAADSLLIEIENSMGDDT